MKAGAAGEQYALGQQTMAQGFGNAATAGIYANYNKPVTSVPGKPQGLIYGYQNPVKTYTPKELTTPAYLSDKIPSWYFKR